jgi:hypothetical protein
MATAKNQLMKTTIRSAGLMILGIGLVIGGCARKKSTSWESIKNPEVVAQLKSFVAEKEAQANAATNAAAPGFAPFFAAAEKGDWLTVSNAFQDLRQHAGQYEHSGKTDERLRGPKWQAIIEIWGAFYFFGAGDEKYSAAYANDIIASIPPGSIYFGGTDPGRFLITGMEKSQVNADPFFLLTQNALADGTYLDYLRSMYGGKIYIPTADDSEKCFRDYTVDVQTRMKNNQLKPSENVQADPVSGRVQISGQVAVMEINGLLAKIVFDQNSNREFYVEESFPLDWMYPYLEPHGLIMKINRQPLSEMSDEIVQRDRDYWTKYIAPMVGDWLNPGASVEEVAAFAEKNYVKKDFNGFQGDPRFIQSSDSQKMFSKLRRALRLARAAYDRHFGKEAHERCGGFCLPPGFCLVSVFARSRDSVCELVDERKQIFRRVLDCRNGGENARNERPQWRSDSFVGRTIATNTEDEMISVHF